MESKETKLRFDFSQFKRLLEDENIKEIWLEQGRQVAVGILVDVPNGFIVNNTTYYRGIDKKYLNEYENLQEDACIDIINSLKEYYKIDSNSDNGLFITKETEDERIIISDDRTSLSGYSITYRRK